MEYIIGNNNILELEHIRTNIENNNYYTNCLKNGKMLAVSMILDGNLIGGCYISKSRESLYLESIFIKNEYRHKGYGHKLIEYILEHKDVFEKYFEMEFLYSKLEPNSNEMIKFYEKLGYSVPNEYNIMKKRI